MRGLPLFLTASVLGACLAERAGEDLAPASDPRPLWPPVGSFVASARPELRFAAGSPRVRVQLCADRACARVLEEQLTESRAVRPLAPLRAGVVFWRVLAEGDAEPLGWRPARWFLCSPGPGSEDPRTARRARRASAHFDADGDGAFDLVDRQGRVWLRPGAGATQPWGALEVPPRSAPESAGDVNGDGYLDVVAATEGGTRSEVTVQLYLGPLRSGVAPSASRVSFPASPAGGCVPELRAGDFDGDGFDDLLASCRQQLQEDPRVWLFRGTPAGYASAPAASLLGPTSYTGTSLFGVLDAEDDGYEDALLGSAAEQAGWLGLHQGGPARGLSRSPERLLLGTGSALGNLGYSAALGWVGPGAPPVLFLRYLPPDQRVRCVARLSPASTDGEALRACAPLGVGEGYSYQMVAADFDGDDRDDLLELLSSTGGATTRLLLSLSSAGAPEGLPVEQPVVLVPATRPLWLDLADLDGDGAPEALLRGDEGSWTLANLASGARALQRVVPVY